MNRRDIAVRLICAMVAAGKEVGPTEIRAALRLAAEYIQVELQVMREEDDDP